MTRPLRDIQRERNGKRVCKGSTRREEGGREGREGEGKVKEEGARVRVGAGLRPPTCRIGPQAGPLSCKPPSLGP